MIVIDESLFWIRYRSANVIRYNKYTTIDMTNAFSQKLSCCRFGQWILAEFEEI